RNRFSNRRLIFQAHINEILQLRAVEPGSVATLRELSDRFNGHMRALMSSGTSAEIQGCLLIQIIFQKLDPATKAKWEDSLAGSTDDSLPTWESMARFLEQRFRTLETVDLALAPHLSANQAGRRRPFNNRSCMLLNAPPASCSHINEILQLRVVEPGSVATLRELSDRFNGHMRALISSGSAAEIQGCLLIQIVLQKLDPATKAKWEDTLAGNNDSLPSWESMARFLEQRCRTLECVDFSLAAYPPSNQVGRGRSSNNRSSCMIINARPALCALFGVLPHALPTCPSFIALPLSQRYDEVRRLTRCFVCLEGGHFARGCSAARCPKCNRRHHALLHHCGQLPSSNNSPPLRSLGSAAGVAVATPPSQSINAVLTQDRPTEVLKPTAN
ncbi:hypothetical protein KR067_005330, partial [Drosophila pandora]